MNFKMFEDKNWFQLIRNRILRLSDGSVIKQDLLSTLLLINIFAYIIGTMNYIWNNGVDKIFQSFISHLLAFMFTINSFLISNLVKLMNFYIGNLLLFIS